MRFQGGLISLSNMTDNGGKRTGNNRTKDKTTVTKDEQKALEGIKFEQLSGIAEDVSNKIVEVMKDTDKVDQYTDLSIEEIKLLAKLHTIGTFTGDQIKMEFAEKYPRLKKSNNRKSLEGLEQMVIAKEQEKRKGITGWFDRNILGKKENQ
jgi:hypothetical protein